METTVSVYIETTIVSYLTAKPNRDIVRSAHQQTTVEWWEQSRSKFDLYTSELVFIEAAAGDLQAAKDRLNALRELSVLKLDEPALMLGRALVDAAALPNVALRDAQHIAIAAFNGIDVLLTWNCRHLANVLLRDKIERVCANAGLVAPKICTPEELLGDLI